MNKRMVAWHEAGHAVVGRYLGLPLTSAGIWQETITRPNGSTFKLWVGEVKAAYGRLSPHKQRIASVAGSVAVYCADMIEDRSSESDWELMFDEIADRMSESDWTVNYEGRNVTDDPGTISEARWRAWYKAMKQAYALLNPETGPLWRELQREQRKLLRRNWVCTFALPNKVAA